MDQFEKLVQDTLTWKGTESGKNPFDWGEQLELLSVKSPPEGPGVIYRFDRGLSSFKLHCLASENVKKDIRRVERGTKKCIKALEIDGEEDVELHFFPTEYPELAEVLCDQYRNIRFPLYEDRVFNLGDPGVSWWMTHEENRLTIYFRNHGFEAGRNIVKLGPLGDERVAQRRFADAGLFFKSFLPLEDMSLSERELSLVVEPGMGQENLNLLKGLFLGHVAPSEIYSLSDDVMGRTLYYYFMELYAARNFWQEVQEMV